MRVVFLLIVVFLGLAAGGGRGAVAGDVIMAMGTAQSPYVIPEARRGLEYDIVKAALAVEGHTLAPRFLPPGRVAKAVDQGQADGAFTQVPDDGAADRYSDVYIAYQTVAVSLASRKLAITGLSDLADKSVVASTRAAGQLGPDFKAMAMANPRYRETDKTATLPILLFLGRADVVIADRAIFSWVAGEPEVAAKTDAGQPVAFHTLFPPTPYRLVFRDLGLRDSFNRGLASLRASGEYARIQARYAAMMGDGVIAARTTERTAPGR